MDGSLALLRLAFVLASPLCAAGSDLLGAPLGPKAAALVDAAVRAEMTRQEAVGVAVGVIRGAKVVYLRGYGYADKEAGTPVTVRTLFRWASVSKPVTAVAALQLFEQGRLGLDDDILKYLPEFPRKDPPPITVRQLLCHQAGVVHYSNGPVLGTKREYPGLAHPLTDPVNAMDVFNRSPLVSTPGAAYNYSTHGYVLLSAVVQRAGGKPFARQLDERVARPLGMTTLAPDLPWVKEPDRVQGYVKKDGKLVIAEDEDVSWKLGGGGLHSDIEDMARFAAGLMSGRLVGKKAEALMWTDQATPDGKPTGMGLGFELSGAGKDLKVYHGGSQAHTRTRMAFYPATGRGVVVMTNSEHVDPADISAAVFASGAFD